MDQEVKAKWVAALRSGDYIQGQGFLKTTDEHGAKHCCLGVLCDLAVLEGVTTAHEVEGDAHRTTIYARGYDCFPPREVWEWAGLGNDNPEVDIPGQEEKRSLVDLNDSGKSFSEIADRIEGSL